MRIDDEPKTRPHYKKISSIAAHSDWIRSVSFSPDGRSLASASDDKTVQLFEVQSQSLRLVTTLNGHSDYVNSVAFSPTAPRLASASRDKTIRIWDAITGAHITTLEGHTGWIHCVAFSPDGSRLASASVDGSVRIWDATSGEHIAAFDTGIVYCVVFSADGTRFVCGSTHSAHLWEIESRTELAVWKGHFKPLNTVNFSPDGSLLASGADDKNIMLYDTESGKVLATLGGHSDWVRVVEFSPDGKTLVSSSDDGTVRLWDVASRSYIATIVDIKAFSHMLSPDGSYLACGLRNGEVWLMERTEKAITGSEIMSPKPDKTPATIQVSQPEAAPAAIPNPPPDETATTLQNLQNMNIGTTTEYFPKVSAKNDISALVSILSTDRIGHGGFGDLFLGTHQTLGRVAMKRPHMFLNEASLRRFLREVELWCSMSHRYILPCLGTCKIGRDVYMISPYIENGDLLTCLERGVTLDRSKLLYEVAEALAHLHHRGIIHGDIKAQNILLGDDGSALLCDFGLAKAFDSMVTSTESKGAGSLRWMPPELFNGESRSMASDVYSFGITIAEVLSGRPPFDHLVDNVAVMVHILLRNGKPPKEPMTGPEGKSYSLLWETAEKCWATDPKDRPYMAQVLGMLFPLTREKS